MMHRFSSIEPLLLKVDATLLNSLNSLLLQIENLTWVPLDQWIKGPTTQEFYASPIV